MGGGGAKGRHLGGAAGHDVRAARVEAAAGAAGRAGSAPRPRARSPRGACRSRSAAPPRRGPACRDAAARAPPPPRRPTPRSGPRYITAMVWLMCATAARSWAMKRYDTPSRSCRSRSRFRIWARMETSSAETGSSSTTRRGDSASARAMATRCRWPPENSCGKSSAARAGRPTRSSSSSTRRRRAARSIGSLITRGSATMAPTRMRGSSDAYGSWNTAWTRAAVAAHRRRDRASARPRPGSGWPPRSAARGPAPAWTWSSCRSPTRRPARTWSRPRS